MEIKHRTFFWPLFGLHILILFLAIGMISVYAWQTARSTFESKWTSELQLQAELISAVLPMKGEAIDAEASRTLFNRLAPFGKDRLTLILPDGKVIGDSETEFEKLDRHNNRPEVIDALQFGQGSSRRYSTSLGTTMLYLAIRIPAKGECKGILRVSIPSYSLAKELDATDYPFLAVVVTVLLIALMLSYGAALRIIGPVRSLQFGLSRIGEGDFAYRLPLPRVPHLDDLARSINQTAGKLQQLERVRQDFVANVSHELRTPTTSIKGFAETLLDGAMEKPETARHFIAIIAHQANELDSIIRDLLELSRLESGHLTAQDFQDASIRDILLNAQSLCQPQADAAGVKLIVTCEPSLRHALHPGLIGQAVKNLIDNAIKYGRSDASPRVKISAEDQDGALVIRVNDNGPGIAPEHLARLFERFYRIDKGRSRDLGGTGLGLSIVKHIALIHNGTATVESRLGEGSSFTIRIP